MGCLAPLGCRNLSGSCRPARHWGYLERTSLETLLPSKSDHWLPRSQSRARQATIARYLVPTVCDLSSSLQGKGEVCVIHTASLFTPHPNLSDEVNRHIVQSEIEGGVFLKGLPPATVLQIQTQHHCYTAITTSDRSVLISGHPKYCPEPVLVAINGSTWGGSMLKCGFVGRGMHLEFAHPQYRTPITTSRIHEIRESTQSRHAFPVSRSTVRSLKTRVRYLLGQAIARRSRDVLTALRLTT